MACLSIFQSWNFKDHSKKTENQLCMKLHILNHRNVTSEISFQAKSAWGHIEGYYQTSQDIMKFYWLHLHEDIDVPE